MTPIIDFQFEAIRAAVGMIEGRATAPFTAPSDLLPPEVTWTLLALVEYRNRKLWAWQIIEENLPGVIEAEQHDEPPPIHSPNVHGTDFKFEYGANASYVTNRTTGERIHLDLVNGAEDIYSCQFANYVRDCRQPGPATRRLQSLFPGGTGLTVALNHLNDCDAFHTAVQTEREFLIFEICGAVEPFLPDVEQFFEYWECPDHRPTLAMAIGDWSMANGTGDDTATRLAQKSHAVWLGLVRRELHEELTFDALCALRNSNADDLAIQIEWAREMEIHGAKELLGQAKA